MQRVISAPRAGGRNYHFALLLLVLGLYLLTMSGHTYSPDEETMLETSRALVTRGTWAMPPSHTLVQVVGTDGNTYSQYGPAQSLAAAPWTAVGLLVGELFPKDQAGFPLRLILSSYNALIAAGLVALFAALGAALGCTRKANIVGALALGFCTFLWPHSRTFFSEPLTALALFASFYMALVAISPDSAATTRVNLRLVASGALFALALATKVQYVVALPAFLIYVAWHAAQTNHPRKPQFAARSLLAWLLGLVLGALPLLYYDWSLFGSPFSTGYGASPTNILTNPLADGLLGLLLSPGKGLLWYAFPLVLTIWGWWRFARAHRAESVLIVALAVPIIVLFSLYAFWHGDGSWGPRYLIPALPFLLLPILPVIETVTGAKLHTDNTQAPRRTFSFARLAVSTALALGFLVNVLGVVVNFDTYINVQPDENARHWTLAASPINGHLVLFDDRVHEWTLRLMPPAGTTTTFKSGFSYSEGDKASHELLPRWTTGAGLLEIRPAGTAAAPISVTLRLSDHRPPELPRAQVTILVDGAPLAAQVAPVEGQPVSTDYTLAIPPHSTSLTIQSDTWNPSVLQINSRNEDLGLRLESVTIAQGSTILANELVEGTPPAPPYYPQPRWYYDPDTHHPADLWFLYLLETGMGRKAMLLLGLPVLVVAFLLIIIGWRILRVPVRQP
ncbi:MAG TPA: hypothetical protein VLQ48_05465 [Chloroflexia bacterium]|nr:hypothetical protein [Chloroflexia bacterium]